MGIFKKYKSDICPEKKELNFLVTNYIGHNGTIKINSKIIVPSGYEFVIGKKGKATDKFTEGEHFVNFSNLPYMCRRFNIDKIENGKQAQKFCCEGYFVNKELRAGKFKTYRKVELGTRAYGIFRIGVMGVYSFRVENSVELVQSLLNEFDYIKTGEAEDIIESWVNDLVVNVLEKNNFVISDIVANNPIIAETLKQAIGKMLSKAGIIIENLQIYKYKLPKKFQQESDNNIKEQLMLENSTIQEAEKLKECLKDNQEANLEENLIDVNCKTEDVSPNQEQQSIDDEKNEQQNDQYVPFGNFQILPADQVNFKEIENQNEQNRTFVDLNLDKLYDSNDANIKRCTRCGAENNINANHCILCGESFMEE